MPNANWLYNPVMLLVTLELQELPRSQATPPLAPRLRIPLASHGACELLLYSSVIDITGTNTAEWQLCWVGFDGGGRVRGTVAGGCVLVAPLLHQIKEPPAGKSREN